jgi:hypothetical protein
MTDRRKPARVSPKPNHRVQIFYWIILTLCALSLGTMVFGLLSAPEGFENEDGFHYGRTEPVRLSFAPVQVARRMARMFRR